MLSGSMVALVTPFQVEGIDRNALARLIAIQAAAGTDAILVGGTTGESATLSHTEHRQLMELAREAVTGLPAGHRPALMVGVGSNSTHEAVELARHAVHSGADLLLSITPYYNRPPQAGLVAHFKAVAAAAEDRPVVLYTVPSRTGVDLELGTVLELAEVPNIVGIKEASGKLSKISEIIRLAPEGFAVLSGEDNLTLPMMALGCTGVISVTANVAPRQVHAMVHAALEGRWAEAQALHHQLFPLTEVLFCETNPIPVKTAIAHWHASNRPAPDGGAWPDTSRLRLPLIPMSAPNRARLQTALAVL